MLKIFILFVKKHSKLSVLLYVMVVGHCD